MNSEIARYIVENRGTYTRDAIRRQLVDAGHDPAEIDETWRALESGEARVTLSRRFWLGFLTYVILLYGLTFLAFEYVSTLSEDTYGVGTMILFLMLVVGLIISVALVHRNRPVMLGLAGGLLTAILLPFVVLVIISGLCVVVARPSFG